MFGRGDYRCAAEGLVAFEVSAKASWPESRPSTQKGSNLCTYGPSKFIYISGSGAWADGTHPLLAARAETVAGKGQRGASSLKE